MLIAVLVFNGAGRRIASLPERANERVFFLWRRQTFCGCKFIFGDDVDGILAEPLLEKIVVIFRRGPLCGDDEDAGSQPYANQAEDRFCRRHDSSSQRLAMA